MDDELNRQYLDRPENRAEENDDVAGGYPGEPQSGGREQVQPDRGQRGGEERVRRQPGFQKER